MIGAAAIDTEAVTVLALTEPMSVARLRELLGTEADGKTDDELAAILEGMERLARHIVRDYRRRQSGAR